MAAKIKGIYKSFKYITKIFVGKWGAVAVKEREMEIGYPTDVKHVAHIGWDGPSGSGPSWMNEFKTAPDFSTSIGSLSERRDPNWKPVTVRGFEEPTGSQPTQSIYQGIPSDGIAHVPKKHKRKKTKSKARSCEREATAIAQL